MSGGQTVLRDVFKQFRDTGETIKKAIILQLFDNEDGSIQLCDGRSTGYYTYGKEDATRDKLINCLEEGGFEEEHLDGSHFSFADVSFEYFWDTVKKDLVVSMNSSHFRLIDSGLGHTKPERTFNINLELSIRRYEMLKREAMAKNVKKEETNIDFGELFAEKTTGGIFPSILKEESSGEEEDESNNELENKTATFEAEQSQSSKLITPNKVEITQLGESHDVNKENLNTNIINNPKPSESIKPENTLTDKSNKPEPKRKPRAPKPKPEKQITKLEKATEDELANLEDELADLDLDDEVAKGMTKVKLNSESFRRGGFGIANEDDLKAPQKLGFSFTAFTN